ncbi:MAG: DUF2938 domain-containing protein [Sneathiella sp.]|nr:DUF2938 domain-containing protein [Sneathiella sp.]
MITLSLLLKALLLGVGATLVLDIWGYLLRVGFKISSLDMCMVGRWIGYMTRGKFCHVHIGKVSPFPLEACIGWSAHFLIGVVFALSFLLIVPAVWMERPTILPAILFGVGTVIFPFCVMQPAFGFGVAASKTPKPMIARLKSLISHAMFGVGIYLSALLAKVAGLFF